MTDGAGLAEALRWFTALQTHSAGGIRSPHKPVLLLAVLDMAEGGEIPTNRIVFGPALVERFAGYWRSVSDAPVGRPEFPFWHLRSEPFWTLVPVPGEETWLQDATGSPSPRRLRDRVRHARLADGLFRLVHDAEARDGLRGALVATYFPARADDVARVHRFEQGVSEYAAAVRSALGAVREPVPAQVRGTAFRRVVTAAYGYTCAVSGARITLAGPGVGHLVEAAHIRAWSDTHDDAATNGIALSPTYHWLFDNGLFTLDERLHVRVSPAARDCVGTVDELLTAHEGRRVRLPAERGLWPGQESLEWHRAHRFLAG